VLAGSGRSPVGRSIQNANWPQLRTRTREIHSVFSVAGHDSWYTGVALGAIAGAAPVARWPRAIDGARANGSQFSCCTPEILVYQGGLQVSNTAKISFVPTGIGFGGRVINRREFAYDQHDLQAAFLSPFSVITGLLRSPLLLGLLSGNHRAAAMAVAPLITWMWAAWLPTADCLRPRLLDLRSRASQNTRWATISTQHYTSRGDDSACLTYRPGQTPRGCRNRYYSFAMPA